MKIIIWAALTSFISAVTAGLIFIPILKKAKAGQPILKYVETHKDKNGTPTMGGLFFILPASAVFLIFGGGEGRIALVAMSIGLAFMSVGALDDFIKIKSGHNEGLKAYQKIIFQLAIAITAGFFSFNNGITVFHIPFFASSVDLGVWTIPLVALIFIAITNSVNLTDGLDGLAGGVSAAYLFIMSLLILLQISVLGKMYLKTEEYERLILLSLCLFGGICGFLIFNVNKAAVFMGDTGSLSLGGFIGAISIFSSNSFFIPVIGIMFVLSSISVIIQVAHFKRTGKRVFLMAPLHHHFQLKGMTETRISFMYSAVTMAVGALSLLAYM